MNIAILVNTLNSGGAERIAGLLSKALSKYHNVYVFLLDTENIVYEYGGEIIDIGTHGPFYEEEIIRYKKSLKIDVSISFMETLNFSNIRTKGTDKVIISERCVQSLYDTPIYADNYRIKRYYNYADAIVSCSYGNTYDLETNYGVKNRIETIYNFINQEAIKEKAMLPIDEETSEFLGTSEFFVNEGRLDAQKQQGILIKEFAEFAKSNSDTKLLILGNGELKNELMGIIHEEKLENRVKILPYTKNPFAYVKRAKALILSSKFEGLPNAVLEAMCLGCPVIATDCLAGPRELLGDIKDYSFEIKEIKVLDRGIIVPFFNCDNKVKDNGLSKAMTMLTEGTVQIDRMQKNQLEYMDSYSNTDIVNRWLSIIDEVMKSDKEKVNIGSFYNPQKKTFIYGAGKYARIYYLSLKDKMEIDGFVVTKLAGNDNTYMGLPVYELGSLPCIKSEAQFFMGVVSDKYNAIVKNLMDYGYTDIIAPELTANKEALEEWMK